MSLPTPHRIVVGHTASGDPAILDDKVPTTPVPGGFQVAQAFAQTSFEPDPIEAFAGTNIQVQGTVQPGGVVMRWVDFPPKQETPMHYTNSIDYLVVTHGTFELVLHDGSKRRVVAGDVVVQLADVHQWNNVGDDWARFVGVGLPSKPVIVDGKTLAEGPLKAMTW